MSALTLTPRRIQLRRTKGWRLPAGAIKVDRSTRFGNPFRVTDDRTPAEAITVFTAWLTVDGCDAEIPARKASILSAITEITGRDLACWCRLCHQHQDGKPLGVECANCAPCHADVLLRVANDFADVLTPDTQ